MLIHNACPFIPSSSSFLKWFFFSSEFMFLLPYLFLLRRSYTHTLFRWVMIGWCYCVSVCEEATPPSLVLSTLNRCLVLQPQYDGHHFKGMLRGCECVRKREKDLLYLWLLSPFKSGEEHVGVWRVTEYLCLLWKWGLFSFEESFLPLWCCLTPWAYIYLTLSIMSIDW